MIDSKDGYVVFSFLGELISKNRIAKTIVLIHRKPLLMKLLLKNYGVKMIVYFWLVAVD